MTDKLVQAAELGFLARHYDLPLEAIKPEFFDFLKIVSLGSKKYVMDNWLRPDGTKSSEQDMHDSMFHHLAKSLSNPSSKDEDSQDDHLLNLACRALMQYTRRKRNIVHEKDKQPDVSVITKEEYENRFGIGLTNERQVKDDRCIDLDEYHKRLQEEGVPKHYYYNNNHTNYSYQEDKKNDK